MMKKNVDLLFDKKVLSTLKPFFESPKGLDFKSLQDKTRFCRMTLLNSLSILIDIGFITKVKKGNAYFYSVIESEAYFLIKKAYFVCLFTYLLKDLKKQDLEVCLFGSYAKGISDKYSDIDLLVIGQNSKSVLDVESKFKFLELPLNIVYKSPLEFATLIKKSPAFYKELQKSKVRLI